MSLFDPRDRELCVDGGCIGLVGRDGYCKECGRPGASATLDPRRRGLRDESEFSEELDEHIIKGDMMPAPEGFEDRRLCPDGTCIGLLGKDGQCRECGLIGAPLARQSNDAATAGTTPAQAGTGNDGQRDMDTDSSAGAQAGATDDTDGDDDAGAFDDRRLCPDGACIGLVGRDGRCRECGLHG